MSSGPVKDTDIAWCAGFFDGEGHVSYHRSYPMGISGRVSAQMYANVPQCSDNIEVLEKFQRIVGLGKLKGPYKTKRKDKHVLTFGVKEVLDLFLALMPYLGREKSNDFRNALLAYENHDPRPTEDDYARLARKREKKRNKLR
jgi:hypothetical protein